ncbi:hypothetical protein JCM11491_005786, partial [Sporobolomyces phaffii]
MGFLPFTMAVEWSNRDDLDLHMSEWWDSNGVASKDEFSLSASTHSTPRRSQASASELGSSSSRRSSRSRSRPSVAVASEGPTVAADDSSNPKSTPAPAPSSARKSLASERRTPITPSRLSSVDPYPFLGDLNARSKARLASPLRSTNPRLFELEEEERIEPRLDPSSEQAQEEAFKILEESRLLSQSGIPNHLRGYFARASTFRLASSEETVKLTAREAVDVAMPYKTRVATIKSFYVDLGEINAFDASQEPSRGIEWDEDGNVKQRQSVKTRPPPNALAWLKSWDVYVAFALRFYPDR